MKQFPYQSAQLEYEVWPSQSRWRKLVRKLLFKPTTVLYVQGFRNPYQNSELLLSKLAAQGFDVYALNFPGHGHSTKLSNISWEVLADIIAMFVHNQNLNKVILVGYSMGGGLALKLLENKPAWLSKTLLIAPFCAPLGLVDLKHALGYIDEFLKDYFDKAPDKPAVMHLDQIYLFEHYSRIFLNYGFNADRINASNHKIVVFLNMKDQVTLPNAVKSALHTLQNVEFVEMTEIEHDLHYITPEQTAQYVREIVNQINKP